jgi:hypothetical protein
MTSTTAERRIAARYPIHGPVEVRALNASADAIANASVGANFTAQIYDISLNGALLSKPAATALHKGELVEVELSLEGVPHVIARAKVVHAEGERVGVEFSDMDTRDFDIFTGLVLMLEQKNRASLVLG